jgi:hypothetical protein
MAASPRSGVAIARFAWRGGAAFTMALATLLGGCTLPGVRSHERDPAAVRAQIAAMLPSGTTDRAGWATDIQMAFASLGIEPSTQNLCATLAITAQESNFTTDPVVPGLARIARAEIDARAKRHHVPQVLVRGALKLRSPDGRSYGERIASVRTERDLSRIYEDLIDTLPLGKRLFGDSNPVRTGGPMQVGVAFAERFARGRAYPYPLDGSIRHEVFSRRGGMYFGIAHLLAYPVSYDRKLYRFADFNAGWYASRNAAFQHALGLVSGSRLALDGDLVAHESGDPGATERAVRSLRPRLDMSDRRIRRALELGAGFEFESTALYRLVFDRAEREAGKPLPRAMVPHIALDSPKITRKLTTEWFATRVDRRYRACLAPPAGL